MKNTWKKYCYKTAIILINGKIYMKKSYCRYQCQNRDTNIGENFSFFKSWSETFIWHSFQLKSGSNTVRYLKVVAEPHTWTLHSSTFLGSMFWRCFFRLQVKNFDLFLSTQLFIGCGYRSEFRDMVYFVSQKPILLTPEVSSSNSECLLRKRSIQVKLCNEHIQNLSHMPWFCKFM